jgi:hypothetical protein
MEMGRAPDQGANGVTGGRPGLNMTESGIEIYPTVGASFCHHHNDQGSDKEDIYVRIIGDVYYFLSCNDSCNCMYQVRHGPEIHEKRGRGYNP